MPALDPIFVTVNMACVSVVTVATSVELASLTVTVPVDLFRIANCCPTTKVVAFGNLTVCVVVPVNCWLKADPTVSVVVPAAVAVVAKFSTKLFIWLLELASLPITDEAVAADTSEVEPVPPLAIGNAVPEYPMAKVPDVVTGEPEMDKTEGTLAATDVTVPVPVGAAHVPSAFRNLPAAASPDPGAGARPLVPPLPLSPTIGFSIAVACVTVRSAAFAVEPVLLPLMVLPPIWAALAFVTAFDAIVAAAAPGPEAVTSPVKDVTASP